MTSVLLTLVVGTALWAGSASAGGSGSTPITFETLAPCSVACPYWTDPFDGLRAACQREPLAPPGTWDDIRVTIPDTVDGQPTTSFRIEIRPTLDYDLFLCRVRNPGPNETYEYFDPGVCACVFPCDTLQVFGCLEELSGCVSATDDTCLPAGTQIVFRAYNWLDTGPCPGEYEWIA